MLSLRFHSRSAVPAKSILRGDPQRRLTRRPTTRRILWGEVLEHRQLLAADIQFQGEAVWVEEGPGPITGGLTDVGDASAVAGAVIGVAVHPTNTNQVYLASVNGGVWRTMNFAAASPAWTPMTDFLPSLAIGAIAVSELNPNLVVAGTGSFTNGAFGAAPSAGIYLSTNGFVGDASAVQWAHIGPSVFSWGAVNAIGLSRVNVNNMLIATNGGLFRSTTGGLPTPAGDPAFSRVPDLGSSATGLPIGDVTDLQIDPGTSTADRARVYAAIVGQGIFRSDDDGDNWTDVSAGIPDAFLAASIKLAVHTSVVNGVTSHVLYAGLINSMPGSGGARGQLGGIYRSTDFGVTWTNMALPFSGELFNDNIDNDFDGFTDSDDPDADSGLHPGNQGVRNFSIVAHPTNPQVVYVGGDRQPVTSGNATGCDSFYARLYMGTIANGFPQWTPIVCDFANDTAPHADTRDMYFLNANTLVETSDGGIYVLSSPTTSPNSNSGTWQSRNGNLRITEVNSVAYSSQEDLYITGNQDNGVTYQVTPGSLTWKHYRGGDGMIQVTAPGTGVGYSLTNNFSGFAKLKLEANKDLDISIRPLGLGVGNARLRGLRNVDRTFSKAAFIPMQPNRFDEDQLLIGYNGLYHSRNGGLTVFTLEEPPANGNLISSLAFGGKEIDGNGQSVDVADVYYAVRGLDVTRSFVNLERKGDQSQRVTSTLPGWWIDDLVVNPDNWKVAYVVGGNDLFTTTDGGVTWSKVSGVVPGVTRINTVAIYNPSTSDPNDEVLLIGAYEGVYYSLNPRAASPSWHKLGTGLPNAIVTDVHVEDELLYIGTFGRGVWSLDNLGEKLNGVIEITGTTGNDHISISLSPTSPQTLVITATSPGTTSNTVALPMEGVRQIVISGDTGDDRVTIDHSHGFVGFTRGITSQPFDFIVFDGGPGDDTVDVTPDAAGYYEALVAGPDASGTGAVTVRANYGNNALAGQAFGMQSRMSFTNVRANTSGVSTPFPTRTFAGTVGLGLQHVSNFLGNLSLPGTSLGPIRLENLLPGLAGSSAVERSSVMGLPAGPAANINENIPAFDVSGGELLRRFFETSDAAILLRDIGTQLTDINDLQQKLSQIGNVEIVSEATATTIHLDATRRVSGSVALQTPSTGLAHLTGVAHLEADVRLQLTFGVDQQGFFLDTATNPEISINNISGSFKGNGRLGFLDVTVSDGTLEMDSEVELVIDLTSQDPTETTTKLRLDQLNGPLTDFVTLQLIGDADETDSEISLSGHFRAALFNFPILQDAQLSLQWPTIADPFDFTVTPVAGTAGARILDLVTTNAQQIRAGLQSLNAAISQLTNVDLLETPIPLLNKTIAEILEGTPQDVELSSEDIAFVDEVVENELHKTFDVALSSNNPQNIGLRRNATVRYLSGGLEVEGDIVGVTADHFTVRFSADSDQSPDPGTTFRFEQSGGLTNILDSLTSGLKDNLPTLQEVISYLADITGVDLINELEIVGQGNDLALEFPLTYDPDPLVFDHRLDFAEAIGGLTLDGSSRLLVSVAPLLRVTVGVRLGAGDGDSSLDLSERFYIVASDPQSSGPALSLEVAATLDDPNASDDIPLLQGTLGFLDVSLAEAPSNQEETAISIAATLDVYLTEGSASANRDDRITIGELGLDTFNPQFSADFQIPGLVLAANVGDATIGTVSVALDHQIQSLSQMPEVLNALVDSLNLQSDFERYLDFNNITPDMVVAALQLLLDHLDRLGGGTVMETDLPLVNRSMSDLVDLGQILLDKIGTLGDVYTEGETTASVVSTASRLEAFLNSRLAPNLQPGETPPVRVIVDADAIRFSLELSDRDRFDTSLPFAFSLGSTAQLGPGFGLVSLDGGGELQLDVNAGAKLTFGLLTSGGIPSINELQQRLFFDTTGDQATGISVTVAANAGYDLDSDGNPDSPPMSFEAAVGPLRVTVPDARALVRIELQGEVQDGGNHGEGPGRLTIQELLSATSIDDIVAIAFVEDTVQARIPIDGFEDANGDGLDDNTTVAADPNLLSSGDALIEVGGLLRNLSSPTFGTDLAVHRSENDLLVPLSQQDLATGDFRVFAHNLSGLVSSQLLSFDSLFAGLQQFLTWGQNLLDIDVFDFKLPLIGVTVGEAFDFFNSEIAACSPEEASSLRDVVSCVIAAGVGSADSSDAVIAAATVIANALANVAHVVPITDLDGDGQILSNIGPDSRLLGNDILQVERGTTVTPVTIFNASVSLTGPVNESFTATQSNSNMRRSGIAIGDIVHYSATDGSQQTATVTSVGENHFVAVMLTPQQPPVTGVATDLVVDTRAVVGISFLAKFAPKIERTFSGLDLGSDFLRFSADPEVTFSGTLSILLGFGITKRDGFFIKTDFLDVDTDPDSPGVQPPFGEIDTDAGAPGIQPPAGRLLTIGGSVSLDGGFEVDLGFLRFDAEFSEGATPQQEDTQPEDDFLSLTLAVDIHDSSTGHADDASVGRLTTDELLDFAQLPSLVDGQFLVQAALDVPLSLSSSSQMPSIGANLVLDWSDSGQPFNVFDGIPSVDIGLQNIQLNAGSFLDTIVTPFLTNLKEKTPLGPIAELMTEPLPVLNKTIYELLRPTIQDDEKLKAFDFLFKIANFINQAGSLNATNQNINYGDVSLSSIVQPSSKFGSIAAILGGNRPIATPVTDPNEGESFPDGEGAPADAAEDAPGANLPVIGPFIEDLAEIGIQFPILRLSSLSQLLIGNDVDLVTVALQPLSVCFRFGGDCDEPGDGGLSFPIFNFGIPFIADVNIEATFAGEFEFAANVAGGFDTRGIRAGNFLHGFYLGDFNPGSDGIIQPSDSERFEIQLGASVSAGVDAQVRLVGLPLGRATGAAGIQAVVGIDLNDDNEDPNSGEVPDSDVRDEQQRHDGRVYIDEIATILQSHPGQPFCLFDLGGEVNAFLDIHLEALGVFSKDFNFDWPLANFNRACTTTPPVPSDLGRLQVGPGGTSQLVLTQTSSALHPQRLAFSATNHPDGDNLQILLVDKNLDPSDGAPVLVISNPTAIDIRANNRFRIRDTDLEDLSELGVEVGQRVQYGVAGNQVFWGTIRQLSGGEFEMEPDPDALSPQTSHVFTLLSGKETLRLRKTARNNDGTLAVAFEDFGPEETGNNFLASVASLTLIATPDFLTAVPTSSITPTGFGAGNDSVTFDPLITAAGHLSGGSGDDFFVTAQGDDILLGGFGDDSLKGGPAVHPLRSSGQNIIVGGGGSDLIEGGNQSDTLVGDYDFSYDRRPPFDNLLVSGDLEGNDAITGGNGDDFIWGDNRGTAQFGTAPLELVDGPSPIAGVGTAYLHDSIFAGGGSDVVFAGPGDDTVLGDDTGPFGNATAGDDFIFAGEGHDRVHGGSGNDTIVGWFGNDILQGDGGDDHLHGGNNNPNDVIPGMGMDKLIGDGLLRTSNGATIVTDGGHDLLDASDSDGACVYGGMLDDVIVGSSGADCIAGGSGNDSIIGGPKSDRIDPGPGDDRVVTGSGVIDGFGFFPALAETLAFNRGIDIIREKLIEGDLVELGSGSINTVDGIATVIPDVRTPSVGSIGSFANAGSSITADLGTDVPGLPNLNQLQQSVKTSVVSGRMDKFVGSSFGDTISVTPLHGAARSIDGGANREGAVDKVTFNAVGRNVRLLPDRIATEGLGDVSVRSIGQFDLRNVGSEITYFVGDHSEELTLYRESEDRLAVRRTDGTVTFFDEGVALTIQGDGLDDVLTIDYSRGNPIPRGGLTFIGRDHVSSVGDIVRLMGTGRESIDLRLESIDGAFSHYSSNGLPVAFAAVELILLDQFQAITLSTSESEDNLVLDDTLELNRLRRNRFHGTAGGKSIIPITWSDVAETTIDLGVSDRTSLHDVMLIEGNAVLGDGMSRLTLLAGAGRDDITIRLDSFALPVEGGAFLIDLADDQGEVTVESDMSLALQTRQLFDDRDNAITFSNAAATTLRLLGGPSVNSYNIANWPGSMEIDGRGSQDLLSLEMTGGSFTAVDLLTLTSPIRTNATSQTATIRGDLSLGNITRTWVVANGSAQPDLRVDAALSGDAGLTKSGAGTLQFTADNAYLGVTTVTSGQLVIDGRQTRSRITLNGGSLAGSGNVGAITANSGDVNPGNPVGLLTSIGNLGTSTTGTLSFSLAGTVPATQHDQLSVTGRVSLAGPLLVSLSFVPAVGTVFTLINNDSTDSVIGTFAGLAEGATFTTSGATLRISYRGGTGNDVTLTTIANTAPRLPLRSITSEITEGGTAILTGQISEPDVGDLFFLEINWGDNSPLETYTFPFGTSSLSIPHVYRDDVPGTSVADEYQVGLRWFDQHGAQNSDVLSIRVSNAAPLVNPIPDLQVTAGELLYYAGSYSDPGLDEWSGTVDFHDGGGEVEVSRFGNQQFAFHRQFATSGVYDATLTITDDDGGVGTESFFVVVWPVGGAIPGDANLDGFVDASDFNIWNAHKFQNNRTWIDGDFNDDGSVDVSDLNVWLQNRFSGDPYLAASDMPRSNPRAPRQPHASIHALLMDTTPGRRTQKLHRITNDAAHESDSQIDSHRFAPSHTTQRSAMARRRGEVDVPLPFEELRRSSVRNGERLMDVTDLMELPDEQDDMTMIDNYFATLQR